MASILLDFGGIPNQTFNRTKPLILRPFIQGGYQRTARRRRKMPQATFWFASPFKEWIGQRILTLSWEGSLTVRGLWERLAIDYPRLRANLPQDGLHEESMSQMVAVIMDGNILSLSAVIRDGAKVDVLAPLSGGIRLGPNHDGTGRES